MAWAIHGATHMNAGTTSVWLSRRQHQSPSLRLRRRGPENSALRVYVVVPPAVLKAVESVVESVALIFPAVHLSVAPKISKKLEKCAHPRAMLAAWSQSTHQQRHQQSPQHQQSHCKALFVKQEAKVQVENAIVVELLFTTRRGVRLTAGKEDARQQCMMPDVKAM